MHMCVFHKELRVIMMKDTTESYRVYFPFLAYARLYDSNLMGTKDVFFRVFLFCFVLFLLLFCLWSLCLEGSFWGINWWVEKKSFFFSFRFYVYVISPHNIGLTLTIPSPMLHQWRMEPGTPWSNFFLLSFFLSFFFFFFNEVDMQCVLRTEREPTCWGLAESFGTRVSVKAQEQGPQMFKRDNVLDQYSLKRWCIEIALLRCLGGSAG